MALFKRKNKLKQTYDEKLISLIQKQREQFEDYKKDESLIVNDQPEWKAHYKLKKALYFYLIKEARLRKWERD
ncbi:DUF2508 family protein [Alkalibacterium kapii]|uniref:DUF2508 domain-containing protein n=1 Tax=Alkalibacterium kapii TaxID=426704 RepID=A0A511AXY6_9LACT|nr:DUF2508 family protein [Alkalibacterium kapii]GEK92183.1 hypothetical protein AKA01nite_18050 [Alkalibacterium kapii]